MNIPFNELRDLSIRNCCGFAIGTTTFIKGIMTIVITQNKHLEIRTFQAGYCFFNFILQQNSNSHSNESGLLIL